MLSYFGAFERVILDQGREQSRYCLMTELASLGTLAHVLWGPNKKGKNYPSFEDKLQIAIQIARTVHYLHQNKLRAYHRDLKAENILITARWTAKLSDFIPSNLDFI